MVCVFDEVRKGPGERVAINVCNRIQYSPGVTERAATNKEYEEMPFEMKRMAYGGFKVLTGV